MVLPMLLGVLGTAAGGVAWLWTSTGRGQGEHVDALCRLHGRLLESYPMAEPPTLFEFLHLDAYAFPFYPTEASLHPENVGYEKAKSDILKRATEMSSPLYEDLNAAEDKQTKKRKTGPDSSSSQIRERVAAIAAVAQALHDDNLRGVYIKRFLPVLTGYPWWNPLKFDWARIEWKDETGNRKRKLSKFCGWKS